MRYRVGTIYKIKLAMSNTITASQDNHGVEKIKVFIILSPKDAIKSKVSCTLRQIS